MIKHIVFFKLKDCTPELMAKTRDLLLSMEGKIEELRSIEVGVDLLRTGRSYDIALVTTFDSLEDLERYQVNPLHQAVSQFITSVRESAVAVDYCIEPGKDDL